MTRVLTTAVTVAAVVGATAGVVMATQVGSEGRARDRTAAVTPPAPTSSTTTGTGIGTTTRSFPGRAGDVFWVNRRVLHDGDLEVPVTFSTPPLLLQRAAGGWVVGVKLHGEDEGFGATMVLVEPDGTVTPFARADGLLGDVSPDGNRYVGQRLAEDGGGYAVWDVATGQSTDVATTGVGRARTEAGSAQFVDDFRVATGWTSDPDLGTEAVVSTDLEKGGTEVLTTELTGLWTVSPDVRFIAGETAVPGNDWCMGVQDLDLGEARTTCSRRFPARPSFAPDSSAVLAVPADLDRVAGDAPAVDLVATGDLPPLGRIAVPAGEEASAFVDVDRIAVLSSRTGSGDGTSISVCDLDGCETVGTYGDSAGRAVLGTTY